MSSIKMTAAESRFADIIWENEPVASGELTKICERELTWKRTTTYTVMRKLCDKGIFRNDGGTVTSVMSKDGYYSLKGADIIDEAYGGSLPAFIAAFTKRKALTEKEIAEIRLLIDNAKEDKISAEL